MALSWVPDPLYKQANWFDNTFNIESWFGEQFISAPPLSASGNIEFSGTVGSVTGGGATPAGSITFGGSVGAAAAASGITGSLSITSTMTPGKRAAEYIGLSQALTRNTQIAPHANTQPGDLLIASINFNTSMTSFNCPGYTQLDGAVFVRGQHRTFVRIADGTSQDNAGATGGTVNEYFSILTIRGPDHLPSVANGEFVTLNAISPESTTFNGPTIDTDSQALIIAIASSCYDNTVAGQNGITVSNTGWSAITNAAGNRVGINIGLQTNTDGDGTTGLAGRAYSGLSMAWKGNAFALTQPVGDQVTALLPLSAPASYDSTASGNPGSSNVSTQTVTLPAGIRPGDWMYAVAAINVSNATLTSADGWTRVDQQSPSTVLTSALFRKRVGTSERPGDVHTFNTSASGRFTVSMAVIKGGSGETPAVVESDTGSGTAGTATHTIPAISGLSTTSAILAFAGLNHQAGGGAVTPPAGWTERAEEVTTNGTGRLIGTWIGTLDGANVTSASSTTFSTGATNATDIVWTVAVPDGAVMAGGSLDITGTVAPSGQTASGAIDVTGSSSASAPASATGSVTVSGSATHSSLASGSFDISGSAAAAAVAAATGSVTLSGSASARGAGVATGTVTLSGSAAAAAPTAATGSVTVSGAAAGAAVGTASGSFNLTATAAGSGVGVAAGSIALTGSAGALAAAAVSGAITLTGSAVHSSAASGSIALTGSASGAAESLAAGSVTITGSAAWSVGASGAVALAGTAAGSAPGAATGSITLTMNATAAAGYSVSGSVQLAGLVAASASTGATGSVTFTGAAIAAASGIASGAVTLSGAAGAAAAGNPTGQVVIGASAGGSALSGASGAVLLSGLAGATVAAAASGGLNVIGTVNAAAVAAALASLQIIGSGGADAYAGALGYVDLSGLADGGAAVYVEGGFTLDGIVAASAEAFIAGEFEIVGIKSDPRYKVWTGTTDYDYAILLGEWTGSGYGFVEIKGEWTGSGYNLVTGIF